MIENQPQSYNINFDKILLCLGTDTDLVVIGSGPGGYVAAIKAAQLGLKVHIIIIIIITIVIIIIIIIIIQF